MKDIEELGNTLNYIQGLVFEGKIVEAWVDAGPDPRCQTVAAMFNSMAGTLEKQQKTSAAIRDVPEEDK
jgi:hypothetical protein